MMVIICFSEIVDKPIKDFNEENPVTIKLLDKGRMAFHYRFLFSLTERLR